MIVWWFWFHSQHAVKHIVVSAPTGSGKTVLFELAIVHLLMSLELAKLNTKTVKIVYGEYNCTFIFFPMRRID